MTIQQLQYVIALDNHRHFVRAAESCFVAQPTLTLQVKKLEEEIGLQIFDRSSHPLKPTLIGVQFIDRARQILRDVDQLKAFVNDDRNKVDGKFKIGVIPTVAPYLLPLFLHQFSLDHPETKLEIMEFQSEEIIARLHNGQLDIGILATPLNESLLREVPVFYEPFLIYGHPDHAILNAEEISAETITGEDLWILNQGHCFRNQILNLCEKARQLNSDHQIEFESGSIETLKNMVQNFSGYTLIPELSYKPSLDKAFVRRFVNPEPAREISLVTHQNFTKELLLAHLRKSIIEKIPKHFRKNSRFLTVNWR